MECGQHGIEAEKKAAKEGSNLQGRKSAKRFADDVKLTDEEAAIVQAQRIAAETGDYEGEVTEFLKHEELLEKNTETKKNLIGITVSCGQRNHDKGVLVKGYDEDDLLRNIITIAALSLSIGRAAINTAQARKVNAYSAQVQANDAANMKAAASHNTQLSQFKQKIPGAQTDLDTSREIADHTSQAAGSMATHLESGHRVGFDGWGDTAADHEYHIHEVTQGYRYDVDQAIDGYGSLAQRTNFPTTNLFQHFRDIKRLGGMPKMFQGIDGARQVLDEGLKLGYISFTPSGSIYIHPDLITPAALGLYALKGAKVNIRDREHKQLTAEQLEKAAETADKPKRDALLKKAEKIRKEQEDAKKKKTEDTERTDEDDERD